MKPLILILICLFSTSLEAQIITTIAGNGTYGYSGDGGPAINAQIADLYHSNVAFDGAGNMYIVQDANNRIRKVDVAGNITTIAGTGTIGYTGDGGPAIAATLYHPGCIVVDNAGNIIFVDQVGGILRKIDPAGIITTLSAGYSGGCSGDGGPVSLATFYAICGLSRDNAGNIYVSDQACNTVRKISTSGIVTTVAGNDTYGFSGDGGPATSAQLAYPCTVGVDNAGNIYIPDAQNRRVRKVNTSGIISTIAGNGTYGNSGNGGPASLALFDLPGSVCVDNAGNIYVADGYLAEVRKIDAAGIITAYAGNGTFGYSGDGGPAVLAQLSSFENISSDNAGNIYVIDENNFVIRKIVNCLTATFSLQPTNVSLCNSGNATMTITAGNTTGLQWQVNTGTAWTDLADNGTYAGVATGTLSIIGADVTMNNYQFRCMATNACATLPSLPATLNVTAPVSPALTIAIPDNTICAGTGATFTATPTNGGTAPVYQWLKNGLAVGANSPTYTDYSLNNADIVSCRLTPDLTCVTGSTALSNAIPVVVNAPLTPAVTISPSSNDICSGTSVTFQANPVNGGTGPIYEWFKNGTVAALNSPSYTDNTLNNGDAISCMLTSGYSCLTTPAATSNIVTMNVTPLIAPSIIISTPNTSVCNGLSASFNATISNGGNAPLYQWQKNGDLVGVNSPGYTDVTVATGDVISCLLTSNGACLSNPAAGSNLIPITVFPDPVVTLDPTPTLCIGSSRLLNAGNFVSYLWNDGSIGRTLSVNSTGTYSVTVTDKNGCQGNGSTTIDQLLPVPRHFLPPDTAMCTYGSLSIEATPGYDSYTWSDNSGGPSLTVTKPGIYWLEVTDNDNCTGIDSIVVAQKDCLQGFYVPTAFTPNQDGKNDYFKPLVLGNIMKYQFSVYNRWGQLVFQSSDPTKGWDGNFNGSKQTTNVFVWLCSYQFNGGPVENKRGTVVLVR